jgi:hypothetical protein
MDMFTNHNIDYDSLDISVCQSNNNLLDEFGKNYLSLQFTGEYNDMDVSLNDILDTDTECDSKNLNETGVIQVSPKIFEIYNDSCRLNTSASAVGSRSVGGNATERALLDSVLNISATPRWLTSTQES